MALVGLDKSGLGLGDETCPSSPVIDGATRLSRLADFHPEPACPDVNRERVEIPWEAMTYSRRATRCLWGSTTDADKALRTGGSDGLAVTCEYRRHNLPGEYGVN